jgi:hypothetical protein
MSASEEQRAEWLDPAFWERLDRLDGRHQRIQSEHDSAVARTGTCLTAGALIPPETRVTPVGLPRADAIFP